MLIDNTDDSNGSEGLQNKKSEERVKLASRNEYKRFLQEILGKKLRKKKKLREWVKEHISELLTLYCLNFDGVHEELRKLYSDKKVGKKPYDPQIFIRSLQLMFLMKRTNLTDWAREVQREQILKVFCGIEGNKAPCVGAYYDFFARLENGPYTPACKHRILPSEQRKARARLLRTPKNKPERREDEPEPEKGVIERLVKETIERESEPRIENLEKLLNDILHKVAVVPSIEGKWITDIADMTIVGDGSPVPAAVNENGKPTCDCRKNGIYRCDHVRKFSDAEAQWGWNNRDKKFIFGYKYFQLVSPGNHHDLPIYINIASANTHEVIMAIAAIDNFSKQSRELLPQIKMDRLGFDALYDMYPFYNYLMHKQTRYAIPYKEEPAKCLTLGNNPQLFNSGGSPLCPGGAPMRLHATDRQGRQLYCCPVKRLTQRDGKRVYVTHDHECPLASICEPNSTLGPIVHVRKDIDPRIHPVIPRKSKEYHELLNLRSSTERSNSMKKYTFLLGQPHSRIMPYAFIRLALVSILEHSKVWVADKLKNVDIKNADLLPLFN